MLHRCHRWLDWGWALDPKPANSMASQQPSDFSLGKMWTNRQPQPAMTWYSIRAGSQAGWLQDEKAEKVHWRGECIWYTETEAKDRASPERLGERFWVPCGSPGFNVVAITFTEIKFSSCTRGQWDFCYLKHTMKTKTSKNTWCHLSPLACV